ncbi:MAG: helix-turn-helix transcriptional regulator [Microcella sp.]|uniref:helix-turn-helix transcriptional regulator n=1 Tax=Microcella sp. TaxID=1913979 RepID=UPI0024CDBC68|nr:helix-turn-helix transcriptional regulator [Microcella sp.]UYN82913.1 MAG: helix-turn-helix transcriptional regulator [Microcella sp.]
MTDATEGQRKDLARRLKESREYVGLTQEDVSTALNIQRTSVHAIEAGTRNVSATELAQLAKLYDRRVEWLLGNEATQVGADAALFRVARGLTENDRVQLLKFAQFLASGNVPESRS